MSKKIKNYVVQEKDDKEFCTDNGSNFTRNVNIRLFKSSVYYKQIIFDCIHYLESVLKMEFEDYKNQKGLSCAELGIPFNIIGLKDKKSIKIYINPKIKNKSNEFVEVETTCGALLNFKDKIKVKRSLFIDLEYYDKAGNKTLEKNISKLEGGFTIQHEIDHSYNCSITEKKYG